MARYGMDPGDRGALQVRLATTGIVQGLFLPKDLPKPGTLAAKHLSNGVKMLEANPSTGTMSIFPKDTRPWAGGFLGQKYPKITTLVVPTDIDDSWDVFEGLEDLPSGFVKDYEYGLGLISGCRVIIDLIEESTNCSVVEFLMSGDSEVDGETFRLTFDRFESLRKEFDRIHSRGANGVLRVKQAFVHNDLREVLSLNYREISLGRLPSSQWMAKVSAGEEPLNDSELDALLTVTSESASQIAAKKPQELARLQEDIQLASLDQLIDTFGLGLGASHTESWWQRFFEENSFALQLIFGGPSIFVESQLPVGEGASLKGKKIADYLYKNALTGTAAIVEIKRPNTRLLLKTAYREGVYGIHSEIGKSITQVLDQAMHLRRNEAEAKNQVKDDSWTTSAPRCFVVAGMTSELDSGDRRKSFELYREHLAGVRLVTYDEVFEQLKSLRGFLSDKSPN